jgi:aryl-alcohol dehydrogenase
VKVRKDAPLELLGPFACSGQTGAGASAQCDAAKSGRRVRRVWCRGRGTIWPHGGQDRGCDPIIAVDIHEKRLALARELGATHVINHSGRSDVVAEIRKITGDGVRFSLETSAQPAVLREAIEALMPAGTCVLLGSARSGTEVCIEMPFLSIRPRGARYHTRREPPQEFIPKLVDFLMQGRMPVDRMMTFYPLLDINQAARDSSTGTTIKPSCG